MKEVQQAEALRLADELVEPIDGFQEPTILEASAAAELRRQHARIAEMEAELEAVGAGGVQRLAAAPLVGQKEVPAQAAQPSDALIEAVDAWFADNTGLGGCSDKDVAELAAIFATQPAAPKDGVKC